MSYGADTTLISIHDADGTLLCDNITRYSLRKNESDQILESGETLELYDEPLPLIEYDFKENKQYYSMIAPFGEYQLGHDYTIDIRYTANKVEDDNYVLLTVLIFGIPLLVIIFLVRLFTRKKRKMRKLAQKEAYQAAKANGLKDISQNGPKEIKSQVMQNVVTDTEPKERVKSEVHQKIQKVQKDIKPVVQDSEVDNNHNQLVCSKCGQELKVGSKFCSACGQTVEAHTQKKFCTNCGNQLKIEDKFCNKCGTKQ